MSAFGNERAVRLLHEGDINDDYWCSKCGHQTPHIYGYFPISKSSGNWQTCLVCNPEAEAYVKGSLNAASIATG